jgi:hypothetical protein
VPLGFSVLSPVGLAIPSSIKALKVPSKAFRVWSVSAPVWVPEQDAAGAEHQVYSAHLVGPAEIPQYLRGLVFQSGVASGGGVRVGVESAAVVVR